VIERGIQSVLSLRATLEEVELPFRIPPKRQR